MTVVASSVKLRPITQAMSNMHAAERTRTFCLKNNVTTSDIKFPFETAERITIGGRKGQALLLFRTAVADDVTATTTCYFCITL